MLPTSIGGPMIAPAETGDTDILDKCLIASRPDAVVVGAALFADISVALNNKSKVQRSMNLRNRLLFQSKQTLKTLGVQESQWAFLFGFFFNLVIFPTIFVLITIILIL